jgi:hypothetical protein
MDKMIDTHLYLHGSYAMGALDYLSNVIVYYINVSTLDGKFKYIVFTLKLLGIQIHVFTFASCEYIK